MSADGVEWQFYDRQASARLSRRNLPHIDMPGAVTFVTMRLKDSMPRNVVKNWHDEIEQWLEMHGLQGRTASAVLEASDVEQSLKTELINFKNLRWHGHLDDCHGACLLRCKRVRQLVGDALLHFHRQRYDVERYVIMPNHVHILIQMRDGFLVRKQFREIQRYSAREINKLLSRSGELWQAEPFDHVVRSPEQFVYLQGYIDDNPVKAGLREGKYSLWHFGEPMDSPM